MSHRPNRRQTVFLARVPADWKPQRPWSVPPAILSAERLAHNVSMIEAVALARAHNRSQLQRVYRRLPVESWAIVAKYLRPRKDFSKADQSAANAAGGEA